MRSFVFFVSKSVIVNYILPPEVAFLKGITAQFNQKLGCNSVLWHLGRATWRMRLWIKGPTSKCVTLPIKEKKDVTIFVSTNHGHPCPSQSRLAQFSLRTHPYSQDFHHYSQHDLRLHLPPLNVSLEVGGFHQY